MNLDFTIAKYTELCEVIRVLPCDVMTLAQFLRADQPQGPSLVLRHDVDRNLRSAVRMAELEACLGIRSTYHIRSARVLFQPRALAYMHTLGHELGYHYETLAKARGDHRRAIALFERELRHFRQVVPVETISMHGSPLSRWDNRDLWHSHDFRKYGLLGEAYLSIDYAQVYYFTDTGRSWDAGQYNLRDRVAGPRPAVRIHTTDDLMAFLRKDLDGPVVINSHPNRWARNWRSWSMGMVLDWTVNQVKRVIAWQHANLTRADAHPD